MKENKEQIIKWHKIADNDLPEEGRVFIGAN